MDLIRFWTKSSRAPETLLCGTVSNMSLRQICSIANASVDLAREKAREMNQTATGEYVPRDSALQDIARMFRANQQSKALKEEIKEALRARVRDQDVLKRRARMLLLSAGWLDLDKFIEHRPPLDDLSFWKRPTTPQRRQSPFNDLTHAKLCSLASKILQRFHSNFSTFTVCHLHPSNPRQLF